MVELIDGGLEEADLLNKVELEYYITALKVIDVVPNIFKSNFTYVYITI